MAVSDLLDARRADNFPDPDDPALYPRFTPEQIAQVYAFASCGEYQRGELVFDQGQRDAPLVLIEQGAVDVVDRRHDGDLCYAHVRTGNFVGDIAMFTGEPTVAACVATEFTRALLVDHDKLRQLVAEHSDIGDLILRTFLARRAWLRGHGYGQMALIGSRWSREAHRLRDFLARNQTPFEWHDVDTDAASRAMLEQLGVEVDGEPVLVCGAGHVVRRPTVEDVATEMGLLVDPDDGVYDLVVVGAGPAGLAAAVYGASEGLRTFVVDADSPGGQAGTSSKIENYLGFLTGISGNELARQAVLQARKFGATLSNPRSIGHLEDCGRTKRLALDRGRAMEARCVLVATGAEYRRLECENGGAFDGQGVYYAATPMEAIGCRGEDVIVVGGGNSAGQAAVYLSGLARRVYVVVRRDNLHETMSRYLTDRIDRAENIEVLTRAQVTALHGDGRLSTVEIEDAGGARRSIETGGLFVMIGAVPRTQWLDGAVLLDDHGFVLTGEELRRAPRFAECWQLDRTPYLLETSVPGVFAAGDVRAGSVKRVASAVGEGAMAVTLAHTHLAAE